MEKEIRSSFELSIRFEQRINNYQAIHLSLSQYEPPRKKELTGPDHTKSARKTPLEHLTQLDREGRISGRKQPLMLLSVRNVLSNLRCLGYIKGYTDFPISTQEESELLLSACKKSHTEYRPYHVLGSKKGCLTLEQWIPSGNIDFDWFISGVPVLWDDEDQDSIYQRIVTEAADHSHVWKIPRGNHPDATDITRMHWKCLQDIFIETLVASQKTAFFRLEEYASKHKLKREDTYLHNILGVNDEGKLCQLVETGMLEDLGKKMKNRGVRRALCVDNSGSITVEFYPKGFSGAENGECRSLIAAPNHRLPGTAYLVVELEDSNFSFLREGNI